MPRTARDVVFVDGVRTPFGKAGPNGLFAETRADDMIVSVIRELLRRNPALPPERIGEVAVAATTQTGDQGLTLGRSAAILAGLPKSVPGYAIDRMCAGAMTAVTTTAGSIAFGATDVAVAGGVATSVPLSNWFLIVVSFGSLLVVTGKRSSEKQLLAEGDTDHTAVRQTLGLYTPSFLRSVRTLSAAVTVSAYCLWAFERASEVHPGHDPIWFQLTIIPFVIALLHVLRLLDSGAGAAPEELALRDHRLQIYGVCWVVLFAIGAYAG